MLKGYMVAVSLLLAAVPVAHARDLSAMQTAVGISHDQMRRAEADYKADSQHVAADRKNLADAQKRLQKSRQQAARSLKKYQEAKARYQRAQKALDNALKQ